MYVYSESKLFSFSTVSLLFFKKILHVKNPHVVSTTYGTIR